MAGNGPGSLVVARGILYVCGPLAVVIAALVSRALQTVLPFGMGPVHFLFQYGNELVGLDLIGGASPLAASFLVMALFARRRVEGAAPPFRNRFYWLVALIIALLTTVTFSASNVLHGGVILTDSWTLVAGFVILSSGVAYWWFRGRWVGVQVGAAEVYSMWTLGGVGSDAIRTFTGLAGVPSGAVVWGGGGFHDLLFWAGLYAVLSLFCLVLLLRLLRPLSRRVEHGTLRS